MDFERILVRATNWIGDAVMSLPALHALRERFPKSRISILARPWVAALYGREPFCDELIPYDVPQGAQRARLRATTQERNSLVLRVARSISYPFCASSSKAAGLKAKWQVSQQLRCRRFDCAILLQNAFEAAALAWLGRIPIRIGYDRDARGWLLTKPIAVPRPGETPPHQRFYYLELLRRAGIISEYPANVAISLSGAAGAAREGQRRLQQLSLRRTIGVAPGAAYGGAKRWLTERFAESAVRLAQERQADIAIFGSAQESPICRAVHDLVAASGVRCLDMSGKTTLAELIELLAACDLCLTNDSGPMHIASALGVPTVAIFGATDAAATGPAGAHSRVVQEPVECSPCLLRECPIDHRCMTRVDSGRVVSVALDLLK